jgi:hypothetical protein
MLVVRLVGFSILRSVPVLLVLVLVLLVLVRRPFSAVVVFRVFGLIPFSFYAYRPFSVIHDDLENCLVKIPHVSFTRINNESFKNKAGPISFKNNAGE